FRPSISPYGASAAPGAASGQPVAAGPNQRECTRITRGRAPYGADMHVRSYGSHGNMVAVIDIGSNSARVMVFEREASSHLRLIAGSRGPPPPWPARRTRGGVV